MNTTYNYWTGQKQIAKPETVTAKVIYEKGGTKYHGIMPTPVNSGALQVAMLKRGVALSSVLDVQPLHPLSTPTATVG